MWKTLLRWPATICLLILFMFAPFGQVSLAFGHSLEQFGLRRIVHPTSENIPNDLDPKFILEPALDPIKVAPDILTNVAITDTIDIGINEDGPDYEMLGEIRDVTHDRDGRLYLLDASVGTVRIFNSDGSYAGSFGKAGTGPGELTYAYNLAVSDSGTVAAVVTGSGVTVVFKRTERGDFVYRNSFQHSGIVTDDACIMNGHLYLLGYKPDASGNIYKLSLEGDLISIFGRLYKSRNTFVVSSLSSRGQIACMGRSGIIGAIKEQVPALTGYSEDGSALWTVRIRGIKPAPVEEHGGTLTISKPKIGESWLYSLFSDAAGNFNVVYMVNSGEQQPAPFHVFRIRAKDGMGTYAGHSRGLKGIHSDYVVQNRPFRHPSVRLIKLDG